jgi:hypothetical protein
MKRQVQLCRSSPARRFPNLAVDSLGDLVFGKRGRKRRAASAGRRFEPSDGADGEDTVLLTVKETAALLGVCGATVYAMVDRWGA